MTDKMLDVSTVARLLNLSPGTIRNLARDPMNPLRGVKIGRTIRIYKSSVDELLLEGERNLLEL